jgi:phage replication O-like protein O
MSKLVPNSTQVPNLIIDELMPLISPATFKILMCICRQTYGWHKDEDQISISRMMQLTGLSNRCVIDTSRVLIDAGIVNRGERGEYGYFFSLNLECDIDKAIQILTNNAAPASELSSLASESSPVNSVHGQQCTQFMGASELSSHTKETIKINYQKKNPLPPLEKQEPSAEVQNLIEMDLYSAARTLGELIGLGHSGGRNLHRLTAAIEQAERRWKDKRRLDVVQDLAALWKEYCAQGLHAPVALHNWIESVGSYIDSDHWKKKKRTEFVPKTDWQGGHVAEDGIYVNRHGKRMPGFICPPKPREAGD